MSDDEVAIGRVIERLAGDREPSARELRAAVADLPDEVATGLLEIGDKMAGLRRRDRELSALISSTRELIAVRDIHDLLQALVDRAHDLMGTDITYILEYTAATDELFVRATHGAVSKAMREVRVPTGIGLVSQIVQARRPLWTTGYHVDQRVDFPHTEAIDAVVNAEHMQALLGVPMISGDRVLGVLLAAERRRRSFAEDEIALLSALADHGAVILQTAHLLEAEHAAAQAAVSAQADAQRRARATETSAEVHEQLTRLVLSGADVSSIARVLSRALGRPVAIAGSDLRQMTATTGVARGWWVDNALTADIRAAVEQSRATGRWAPLTAGGGPRLPLGVVAAMAGPRLLGAVLVGIGAAQMDEYQRRTVERAAQIVALITMQREAVMTAEEQVRGELVGDLLSGRADLDTLRGRARSRGVDLDQDWVVVFAELADRQRWTLTRALAESDTGWLVGHHGSGVVVLVSRCDPATAAEQVHARLRELTHGSAATVVAAPRAAGPLDLSAEAHQAVACAALLSALGTTDAAVTVDAYAPYLAMFGPDAARTIGFVNQMLGPVLEWDRTHGSNLVSTLESYVASSGSVTRAAQALYVHPNTVRQRLDRVTGLLGDGWRDPEPLFRLGVALRLHVLRGAHRAPAGSPSV